MFSTNLHVHLNLEPPTSLDGYYLGTIFLNEYKITIRQGPPVIEYSADPILCREVHHLVEGWDDNSQGIEGGPFQDHIVWWLDIYDDKFNFQTTCLNDSFNVV